MTYTLKILCGVFSCFMLITSCSDSQETENKTRDEFVADLLHDQSSKVWIIDEHIIQNEIYAEDERADKNTITFFNDGTFYMQTLDEFAYLGVSYGEYRVNENNLLLLLNGISVPNTLKILHANKDSIVAENKVGKRTNMRLRLLPLDKPLEKKESINDENVELKIN